MVGHFERMYIPLRITFGLVPLLAGMDKFLGLLADWPSYLSPGVAAALPVSPAVFMGLVGIVEIAVGVMVLDGWTRLGARLAMVWLVLIAINLVLAGRLDIAVRDLAMAVGAWTLVQLEEIRQDALEGARHEALQESAA